MLVMSRKVLEEIRIGQDIIVKVIKTGANRVQIGIEAPDSVRVLRNELYGEHEESGIGLGADSEVDLPEAGLTSTQYHDGDRTTQNLLNRKPADEKPADEKHGKEPRPDRGPDRVHPAEDAPSIPLPGGADWPAEDLRLEDVGAGTSAASWPQMVRKAR